MINKLLLLHAHIGEIRLVKKTANVETRHFLSTSPNVVISLRGVARRTGVTESGSSAALAFASAHSRTGGGKSGTKFVADSQHKKRNTDSFVVDIYTFIA